MRKLARINEFLQSNLSSMLLSGLLKSSPAHYANQPSFVTHWPTAELTFDCKFECFFDAHSSLQNVHRRAHQLRYLASAPLPTGSSTRQVNAILDCECLVDRLRLQTRGDEKADKVGNHQRHNDRIILRRLENH